ncbi:MAG: hypothetical protein IKO66_04105 [Paludibacteraceae bacterium]|nr:hypothetical protein [Paludibacteraceae bacterium]
MDTEFNEFWEAYKPNEIRFPRRRAATFRAWHERTKAARMAMLAKVKAEGGPDWKNPYFYVVDFPEPQPTNYNGRELPKIPLVSACYKGKYGIYSADEAECFGMTDVKPFK